MRVVFMPAKGENLKQRNLTKNTPRQFWGTNRMKKLKTEKNPNQKL